MGYNKNNNHHQHTTTVATNKHLGLYTTSSNILPAILYNFFLDYVHKLIFVMKIFYDIITALTPFCFSLISIINLWPFEILWGYVVSPPPPI
jgi:hypothetical protein